MRVAWFSPLPPDTSGIAAYSADVLELLDNPNHGYSIDRFVDRPAGSAGPGSEPPHRSVFNAHDFVWKQQRAPYDLIVYQLGNARWHDYMWAYMLAYPGLVVLHDIRVHHARARSLLKQGRPDDYRREFRYDHPDAPPGVEEYAVEGLSGSIYYFWSMLPAVLRTARLVAVHNARVAADLREETPGLRVDTIRMGVPASLTREALTSDGRETVRRGLHIRDAATVFVAFGHVTARKAHRADSSGAGGARRHWSRCASRARRAGYRFAIASGADRSAGPCRPGPRDGVRRRRPRRGVSRSR